MLRQAFFPGRWVLLCSSLCFSLAFALIGCGEDDSGGKTSRVIEEPEPADAVAEAKLQLEDFRTYYYCDRTYPQVCDDLPTAYVLPRESGAFRIVFYENLKRTDTFVDYHYVSVDLDTKTVTVEGSFAWHEVFGEVEREGEPLWGIPE